MNPTTNPTEAHAADCTGPEMIVTCGIVRCVGCFTEFPEHPDSVGHSTIVSDNQFR